MMRFIRLVHVLLGQQRCIVLWHKVTHVSTILKNNNKVSKFVVNCDGVWMKIFSEWRMHWR